MNANAYELLAIAMRYVFAGLMVLIVLRAWRITYVDQGRAAKLRRLSPETGIIGEMLVAEGDERARTGMRYPLTLEGTLGASRGADIRVRSSSVKGRHAYYQMTDEGLFMRGHAGARLRDGHGRGARELMLHDGECFFVGRVRLMLVLTGADAVPEEIGSRIRQKRRRERREAEPEVPERDDSLFNVSQDIGFDDLFMSNPAGNFDVGDETDENELFRRRERRYR